MANLPRRPSGLNPAMFGQAIGWGTGHEAARKRMATITIEEIRATGITREVAVGWRRFYETEASRRPANPSAAGRIELMNRVIELLDENPS